MYPLETFSITTCYESEYDVLIKVGKLPHEISFFQAHSHILCERSAYFNVALSNTWAKRNDKVYLFSKENISAKVFNILLGYIYSKTIDLVNLGPQLTLDLLIAADELIFEDILESVQTYLVSVKPNWINEHLIDILNTVTPRITTCRKLFDYCWNYVIACNPEILFDPSNLSKLNETALTTILQSDDLPMKEIDIWNYLIDWARSKVIDNNNYENAEKLLKNTISIFFSLIRFNHINNNEFITKVLPYIKFLPENLARDYILFHAEGVTPTTFSILPPRLPQIRINSSILKPKQAILLASWIDGKSTIEGPVAYSFRKLYHASKDGVSNKEFHRYCDKAGPTIVILKISNDDDNDGKDLVIGGYNPVINGWRRGWFSSIRGKSSAFLFSFNNNDNRKMDGKDAKISRIREQFIQQGIYDHPGDGICFGSGPDLWINLNDCNKKVGQCMQRAYTFGVKEKRGFFYWDDLEVFEVQPVKSL
ncbi:7100_t:CDS:1 [Ambispora leptoticha]|uniref:7100_t:CDS:1 n=1 Tax=Ambispora leptoticha TaxID=144679 RepID=A0A9N9B387_9GLOM|nr:7100_t:CDS:1 [Ambispora leptoticha]